MRLKQSLKTVASRALRAAGHDIVRDTLGNDPFRDLARILPGTLRTIFDVGANVGQTSTALAARYPDATIYAFEPDPKAFAQLQEATRPLRGVKAFNAALGDESGTQVLHLTEHSEGNSLLPVGGPGLTGLQLGGWTVPSGEVRVQVERLDAFCRSGSISSIDLLKVDTQGAELLVFTGAGAMLNPVTIRAIFCEVMFVEVYQRQAKFAAVYAALTARDYRLVDFYNAARGTGGEILWCDALFVAPSGA